MEILPAIDLRGGCCVRLRQGDYAQETVFGDNPAEMAARWEREGGTRLHLVDLDGAKAGRPVNIAAIKSIVETVKIPCELGGGLRDEATIRQMIEEVGIDRAIIGLDARNGMVATAGWLDVSQTSALELARQFADLDLAAVIYTNIANDGMMQGIDQGTIDDMLQLAELGLPVIASGGVTTLADIERLAAVSRKQPKLIGAIVGRALYEGTIHVQDAVRMAR